MELSRWVTYAWETWFSLRLPDDWSQTQDAELITICDETDGAGALQISLAHRSMRERATFADARRLAEHYAHECGWPTPHLQRETAIPNAEVRVFMHIENSEDPGFWQVWIVLDDTRAATITYVCDIGQQDVERDLRDQIVRSFRWRA